MIHLVWSDTHCLPNKNNDRATWLSKLIMDVKPDTVINLGDSADMESLCSYEKGKASFVGKSYKKDIEAHLDFHDKLWSPIKKAKKKKPRMVFLHGNHEQRIGRALEVQPELEGTIGYKDLCLEEYYDDVILYSGATPGSICIDGITYSHFFVTGVSGRPSSGSNIANLALSKALGSITQGHTHVLDFATKPTINSKRLNSLVTGCFIDSHLDWAGQINDLWWRGLFIKRSVGEGNYDLEVISMDRLKKEYS